MKLHLTTIVLLLISFHIAAQSRQLNMISIPTLKKSGRSINEFVPTNWSVLKSVSGDLNGDKQKDHVLILGISKKELLRRGLDTLNNEMPRILAIVVAKGHRFLLDEQSHRIILPDSFAGNFDPIEFIEPIIIDEEQKSLTISMYGGNKDRWAINYVFIKNNTMWTLVSADTRVYDSTAPEEDIYSYTFDFKTKEVRDNKKGTNNKLMWNTKLILKDMVPFDNEIIMGVRI